MFLPNLLLLLSLDLEEVVLVLPQVHVQAALDRHQASVPLHVLLPPAHVLPLDSVLQALTVPLLVASVVLLLALVTVQPLVIVAAASEALLPPLEEHVALSCTSPRESATLLSESSIKQAFSVIQDLLFTNTMVTATTHSTTTYTRALSLKPSFYNLLAPIPTEEPRCVFATLPMVFSTITGET